MYKHLYQLAFFALLTFSVWLLSSSWGTWRIDTDLNDVTPEILQQAHTRAAVVELRNAVANRITFLLQSADRSSAAQAARMLRSKLEAMPNLQVLPDASESSNRLLQALKEYRFNFLTAAQQETLQTMSQQQIAGAAQAELYSALGSPRIFDFAEDPLGWHSVATLALLNQGASGAAENAQLITLHVERGAMDMQTQASLAAQFSQLIEKIDNDFDVSIDSSGVFFFAADAARSAKRDVSLISSISTLGVIALLWLAFGTLRSLFLPTLSVLCGVGFAALFTHWLYGSLHILTIVFGASLIGIAIDYALHFMVHKRATDGSQVPLFRALSMSLATSVVGYAALGLSGLAALEKVAVFSCAGLLMAWLTVVVVGQSDKLVGLRALRPALYRSGYLSNLTRRLQSMLAPLAKPRFAVCVLAMMFVAIFCLSRDNTFSDDPRVFFKADAALIASEQRVAKVGSEFEPGRYIAIVGDSITEVYERFNSFQLAVGRTSTLSQSNFTSLPGWLPSPSKQQQNYLSLKPLYAAGGAAELLGIALTGDTSSIKTSQNDYLAAAGRDLSPALLQKSLGNLLPPIWQTSSDGSIVSFVLVRKGVDADQLKPLLSNIDGVEYVNSLASTQQALAAQRETATLYLAIAVALIALLLLIRYRKPSVLQMLLIPLGSISAVVCLCVVSGTSINLFHLMALFLVLGFGMDYAIFSHEFSQDNGSHLPIALQAILLSALTSLLSFGLLATSSIPVVNSFGLTLLLGNSVNLIIAMALATSKTK